MVFQRSAQTSVYPNYMLTLANYYFFGYWPVNMGCGKEPPQFAQLSTPKFLALILISIGTNWTYVCTMKIWTNGYHVKKLPYLLLIIFPTTFSQNHCNLFLRPQLVQQSKRENTPWGWSLEGKASCGHLNKFTLFTPLVHPEMLENVLHLNFSILWYVCTMYCILHLQGAAKFNEQTLSQVSSASLDNWVPLETFC
jgi:hypothetical protein